MKVKDLSNDTSGIPRIPIREDRKVTAGKDTDFKSMLVRADQNGYEQQLEELVGRIMRQSESFSKKIDIRELNAYKKLISEFLDVALNNSRKFSKQSLLDKRGRHKVYALVRKINSEVDNLTEDVLKGEKDNIGILKRLDDIRGLILDMVL